MAEHALTPKELQWVMRQTIDLRLVAVAPLHGTPASSEQTIRDKAEQAYRIANLGQHLDLPLPPTVQTGTLHYLRGTSAAVQSLDTVTGERQVVPLQSNTIIPAPVVLHVLVVDDIAMNRDFAGNFLRAAGHKVTCVESGAEAIAAVETTDFNVVLMDVRMPEMDGLEATRQIRALEGTRGRVPIVALTARAFAEQVAECREAGMNSHVSKPFDPHILLTAVLRASAAGLAHGRRPVAKSKATAEQATSTVPVIATELMLLDPTAFECSTSYLTSEAVDKYLVTIAEQGEAFLQRLRDPVALARSEDEICETARTIAGSAGMFGFDRLTSLSRRLERGIQLETTDVPARVDAVKDALKATLQVIYDRRLATVEA